MVGSHHLGTNPLVSADDLQRKIPMRRQLLASAGCRDTAIVAFEETALGDRYSLVRAAFRWTFETGGGEPDTVTLPATYVVDRGGDAPPSCST